ncbi:MAG: adenylate/guanylate cyclase domain-containing protein [Bacteroidia bacterium]
MNLKQIGWIIASCFFVACGRSFGDKPLLKSVKSEKVSPKVKSQIDEKIKTAKQLFDNENSLQETIKLLKKANELSTQHIYNQGIIISTYELGKVYLSLSDNANATKYFYASMRESHNLKDSTSESNAYLGLGLVMYNLNKWEEAISNFELSLNFNPKQKNQIGSSTQEYLLALCFFRQNELEKSKQMLEKVQLFAKKNNDWGRVSETQLYLNNISSIENLDKNVLTVYDTLLTRFQKANEKVGVCYTLEGKARALLKFGETQKAVQVALQSLNLAQQLEMNFPLQSIYDIVIESEYKIGDYKNAATHMLELKDLKKQTNAENANTDVVLLMADFEFDKKEADYNAKILLKSKQQFIFLILTIAFFIGGAIIFVSRKSIVRERKRSDDLLHNILPEDTAKELKLNGFAGAKAHSNVTIVFADVNSFTKIASTLKPEVLVKMLDSYFGKFDDIIKSYHGSIEKIKTIGDAYMFVVGLARGGQNDAHNAVKASMQMLKAVDESKIEMQNRFGCHFEFRFGIHTGDVVSGVVGSVKYAFDIWGDAVNIAARMEENGVPGRINVSEKTYQLIQDDFEFESRGKITMKNRGNIGMYFAEQKA